MEKYDFVEAKKRWHKICENQDFYMPIYHKDWYWKASCKKEDDWKVIVYEDEYAIAAFPFMHFKKLGLWRIENPWAVSRGGIWIHYRKVVSKRKTIELNRNICQYMIDRLPKFDHMKIKFLPEFEEILPFIWNGFDIRVSCNQYIKNIKPDEVINNCSISRRNRINSCKKNLILEHNKLNIDQVVDFFYSNYPLINNKLFEKDQFRILLMELIKRNAVRISCAYKKNILEAIVIFIFDDKVLYHQFAAREKESKSGISLINYDSIKYAMESSKKFDFEGSVLKGVFEINESYTGTKENLYVVEKKNLKYRLFEIVKILIRRG